jgi:hypothetical protein
MSSTDLTCEYEVNGLSRDKLLSGTGEAIDDNLIGVAVVYG